MGPMKARQGRRERLNRESDERGMTLIELMVSFLLTTILCVTLMSAMTHLVQDTTSADTRININAEEQLAMDTITRQIRAATPACGLPSPYCGLPPLPPLEPVNYAGPDEITFYASLYPNEIGDGPVKYDITLTGSTLVETTWQADTGPASEGSGWTYTGASGTQTLATDVDSSHGPLFSYYPEGVDPVTTPTGNLSDSPVMTQAGSCTTNQCTNPIDSVRIDLWMDPGGDSTTPVVEDTTTVNLINVDYRGGE
jgi:type II secretory pathway pseudopilin PulG